MTQQQTIIAPSILSADFCQLGQEVADVEVAGADWLHFDVMDNHYVPNLSFGPVVCRSLKKRTKLPIDVHLMTENVDSLIEPFVNAGAYQITFHPDSTPHAHRTISTIKNHNIKVGIALNPSLSFSHIEYLLEHVDLVLVMTVNPGFASQTFINAMLPKIEQLRSIIDHSQKPIRLQVDGGITPATAALCREAGADTFVAGNAVFNTPDYATSITNIRSA